MQNSDKVNLEDWVKMNVVKPQVLEGKTIEKISYKKLSNKLDVYLMEIICKGDITYYIEMKKHVMNPNITPPVIKFNVTDLEEKNKSRHTPTLF